jgi:hypothetical protein
VPSAAFATLHPLWLCGPVAHPENGYSLRSDTVPRKGRNSGPSREAVLEPSPVDKDCRPVVASPDSRAIDIVYFAGLLTQEAG